MNFQFGFQPFYANPEEAAVYFTSAYNPMDFYQEIHPMNQFSQYSDQSFGFYQQLPTEIKPQNIQFRPTEDQDVQDPHQFRPQANSQYYPFAQNIPSISSQNQKHSQQINFIPKQPSNKLTHILVKQKRQPINAEASLKNYKKNTQSNLINNIFSYICSKLKSQKELQQILMDPQALDIFYIFVNNLKKLNGRYVNRKNIKALCEIQNKKDHAKMLAKSVKRIQILPIKRLKEVLRRLIFSYLRGSNSLFPLLTSKKICKEAIKEHLEKRRELIEYLVSQIDYNLSQ